MKRAILVSVVALATSGCVSTQTVPIAPEHETRISTKSLGHAHFAKPDFTATTRANISFGLIGAAVATAEGNKISQENKVQDPAVMLSSELASALRDRYKISVGAPNSVEVNTDDIAQLKSQFTGADLLLTVRTVSWGFSYLNWSRYQVIYGAKVRLIDLRAGNILAEGFCWRGVPDDVGTAPTYDELLANGASLLKSGLQQAGAYCLQQFRTAVFRLE